MKEQIVPASMQDYEEVYNEKPSFSMRLFKVMEDDKRLALFGYYYAGGQAALICKIEGKYPAKKILRVARAALNRLKEFGLPLIALSDQELCTAPTFLRHLGFEPLGEPGLGKVYKWANTQAISN